MKAAWLALLIGLLGCNQQRSVPDLVVYTGHEFQLLNVEAKTARSIPCSIPVGSFSIAPNGRFLVFASHESKTGMGYIYHLDFGTGQIRKLTSEPFYFTAKRFPPDKLEFALPPHRELYSDVEISPDDRFAAFAVHSVGDNDGDDLVGLSGPIAVMDLSAGTIRILSATEKINDGGPAYANTPRWSEDGLRLMMAFEVSGVITTLKDGSLREIDKQMSKPFEDGATSPRAWWSNNEILFVWNPKPVSGIGRIFRLNLVNGQVSRAPSFMPPGAAELESVTDVDANSRYLLVRYEGGADLYRRTGEVAQRFSVRGARLRLFN